MTYDNSTECYTELYLVLQQGAFVNWSANTAAGFVVQELGPTELKITHSGGFLPLGFQGPLIFTLPVGLVTTMGVSYINECPPGTGCEIFGGIPIESCPDPLNASIIGVKYRECGSLPFTNQPALSDWTIELLNADSNIIAEQVTDADGNYAFYDLPLGIYIVKKCSNRAGVLRYLPAESIRWIWHRHSRWCEILEIAPAVPVIIFTWTWYSCPDFLIPVLTC
ncbi:MAG: hypothetical protein IPH31_01570 [Lewinellaceae bacterium]|nr:hypothetical protein [Lewinellaceae bacterium]